MSEEMTLLSFFGWLLSAAGASAATYWLMESVPKLKDLAPAPKRFASLGLSAVLPIAVWWITLGFGYTPWPTTWQGYIEAMFAVAAPAVLATQALHGAAKLRGRAAPALPEH